MIGAEQGCDTSWLTLFLDDSDNRFENRSTAFAVSAELPFRLSDFYGPIIKFKVPSNGCPPLLSWGILNNFNRQRHDNCLPPLVYSPTATAFAQSWAEENTDMDVRHMYKLAARNYGQLIWRDNIAGFSNFAYDAKYSEPFEIAVTDFKSGVRIPPWGKNAMPRLYNGKTHNKWREFTDEEWEVTRNAGIGCSAFYQTDNAKNKRVLYFLIVVFFDRPLCNC